MIYMYLGSTFALLLLCLYYFQTKNRTVSSPIFIFISLWDSISQPFIYLVKGYPKVLVVMKKSSIK